jgi:hypothetical protein
MTDRLSLRLHTEADHTLAPGFIVLDGHLRANSVYHKRKAGNPEWKREAVVQTGAFAAGIAAGVGIAFIITASPVGLVIGLVAAGALAVGADYVAQGFFDKAYDWFQ